jgi:hypothetical protein
MMGAAKSTRLARRVRDLIGALNELYYAQKYGALAQRLGRPSVHPDQRRGLLIIQIDGLSYDHIVQALTTGAMPYLGRLLAEHRLSIAPWRCGLPSTTPAVQAGIMYGNRFDIPGFRWYEKEHDTHVVAKRPDQMQAVCARIRQGRPGILQGGTCYVSMVDGDAESALFTLSALHPQRFFESVRGAGILFLFLLNPLRLLSLLRSAVISYLTSLGRRLVALVRPSVLNPLDVFSPFVSAVGDALFTEVQTFGVMLDIFRCTPAIYANYNKYDEVAHKLGPGHPAAFRVLRDIDRRIHQIDRMRARCQGRLYDLYLISDHGNSPSVPFRWHNGASLGRHIAAEIGNTLSVGEQSTSNPHSMDKVRFLLDELESLEACGAPGWRRALAASRTYVGRHALRGHRKDYDMERQQDVVVSASGPLAHIYFTVSPQPLDLDEMMRLYPQLLDRLLDSSGIGALVARAGECTVVLGNRGGTVAIGCQRKMVVQPHPLTIFGDTAYAEHQLHQLAHFPHAGDLIALGEMLPDGTVVTFEEQLATHGGLGGPQIRPFIAWSPERPLVPETLNDAQDLYSYFARHYLDTMSAGVPD